MRFLKPSHPIKILIATVFAVVVIVGALIFTKDTKGGNPGVQNNLINLVDRSNVQETDADGDGLLDWEEDIRKTDPKNPDSDGDGTNDGDEVAQNRNPAIAGPDDQVSSLYVPENESPEVYVPASEFKPDTLTSRSALSLFQSFILSGGNPSPKDIEELGGAISGITDPEVFSSIDVIIVENSRENRVVYADIILRSIDELKLNRVQASSLQNNSGLPIEIKAHQTFLARLKSTETPEEAVKIHLDLMNAVSQMTELMRALYEAGSDPLYSAIILGSNEDLIDKYDDALERIDTYITNISKAS